MVLDLDKMNPLTVRLFDVNTKKLRHSFLTCALLPLSPQGLQKQYFLKLSQL